PEDLFVKIIDARKRIDDRLKFSVRKEIIPANSQSVDREIALAQIAFNRVIAESGKIPIALLTNHARDLSLFIQNEIRRIHFGVKKPGRFKDAIGKHDIYVAEATSEQ